ncbi:MAG: lysyl oxidase-like [Myxococcales bacterium]|nr:lysyl oxidase-like [Myxococcales bacterium]
MLVGCYAPHPQTGAPCGDGACPGDLVCSPATNTCELSSTIDGAVDGMVIDGCTPQAEICGDGIDQDCDGVDPVCVANDGADGAIDVSAGGTFTVDMRYANDDASDADCGGIGGRDVFYKIVLPAQEIVYADTFGSDFRTVVRVFPGKACSAIAGASPVCNHDACGGAQSQLAGPLPAGTSCIVVDQDAAAITGMLTLRVTRGGRDGASLGSNMQTYTGNSCTGTNVTNPGTSCAGGDTSTAEDAGYYFTVCPAQTLKLDASTCVDATMTAFDTVIYLRKAGGNNLGCNDDATTCTARPARPTHADGSILTNVASVGPGLFWLTVDGYSGACGAFRVDTNLR